MTLETTSDGPGGGPKLILTRCPLCGVAFAPNANRPAHFRNAHDASDI